MKRILYIAPFVSPAVGGCAIYTSLLLKMFESHFNDCELYVLTERHPQSKNITDNIYRWFPFRAGRGRKDIYSYIQYAMQNMVYLCLPFLLLKTRAKLVFVHSSLIAHPNVLTLLLRICRYFFKIKIVLDIRDPKFSEKNIADFVKYDYMVSCSKNITIKLIAQGVSSNVIFEIPVMIDHQSTKDEDGRRFLNKYELRPNQYLFSASGIVTAKGLHEAIDLLRKINERYHKNLCYVVCGKNRDWSQQFLIARDNGLLKYIGEITHEEVVSLGASAYLDINLSSVDSMPRHSLEVIAAGGKVLLPQGVPEFDILCPELVATLPNLEDVATQAVEIAEGKRLNKYPYKQHYLRYVADKYRNLIDKAYATK